MTDSFDNVTFESWARGRDIRRPEKAPTTAEMIAGMTELYREALTRWRHGHRWVMRLKREQGDEFNPKAQEATEALVEQARGKADALHWKNYIEHYGKQLAAEVAAAAAEAKTAGHRDPGEDDGDEA
jgi:hypothetical protein